MKKIINLYHHNPIVALICDSIAFFAWAFTMVLIITIMAVAFTA